jgi:NTP pyrophosphatase (non-canonical NTP hydrolase)
MFKTIQKEINRQDKIHPSGYLNTRDSIRLGLASIQDELDETLEEWRKEKKRSRWKNTKEELLQTIAVAIRLYRNLK